MINNEDKRMLKQMFHWTEAILLVSGAAVGVSGNAGLAKTLILMACGLAVIDTFIRPKDEP